MLVLLRHNGESTDLVMGHALFPHAEALHQAAGFLAGWAAFLDLLPSGTQDIANVGTDEAVMKIARERLNLVEDGEMIFIDSDK